MQLSGKDTIAIFGQGPVGLSATQLASEMGEAVTEVRRIAAYVPDVAPLDEEDEDSSLTIEQSTPATANHYAITVPGAEDPFDFSYVAEAVLDALTSGRRSY